VSFHSIFFCSHRWLSSEHTINVFVQSTTWQSADLTQVISKVCLLQDETTVLQGCIPSHLHHQFQQILFMFLHIHGRRLQLNAHLNFVFPRLLGFLLFIFIKNQLLSTRSLPHYNTIITPLICLLGQQSFLMSNQWKIQWMNCLWLNFMSSVAFAQPK
jgi:hypothetical protein